MSHPVASGFWRPQADPAARERSTRPDAPGTGGPAWHSAWQSEVERSQAAEWLGQGRVDSAGSAWQPEVTCTAASSHAAAGRPASLAWSISASAQGMPAPGMVAALHTALAPSPFAASAARTLPAADAATAPHLASPPPRALPTVSPAPWTALQRAHASQVAVLGDTRLAHAGKAADAGAATAPQPAARLHAEWSAEGVRVWLGLDAGVELPTAWLVQQLQRTAASVGSRLLSFTCNGQPVDLRGASALAHLPSAARGETPPLQPVFPHLPGR